MEKEVKFSQRGDVEVKRFLDIFFSILFIILLSPVMLIVSLSILIFDGKPVMFYQKRVGYNNEIFNIYKFRTMKNGTKESATAKLKDIESSLTKVGRILREYSIDELPQFFNVLKGDMSFVGPRPLIPKEKKIRKLRKEYNVFSVKPGITGWAQVNGRDNISDEQKAEYDKYYVENYSLSLDAKILLKTVINVVKGKDVNDSCGKNENKTTDDERENLIKVMSYNILCYGIGEYEWQKRAPHVVDLIKRENPDLFGVQEATPEWMEVLKKEFGNYGCVGVGRDDGNMLGEFVAIFYKKERFLIKSSGHFWLSETPNVPSKGWDSECTRLCTWVILKDRKTDKQIIHLNTHIDHVGKIARKESVKLIIDKIRGLKNIPIVVTGDFNLREGGSLYNIIVNSDVLRDTKYSCEDTMDEKTFNNFGGQEAEVMDFVFINDNFKTLKYRVVQDMNDDKYISDHYPVVSEITEG